MQYPLYLVREHSFTAGNDKPLKQRMATPLYNYIMCCLPRTLVVGTGINIQFYGYIVILLINMMNLGSIDCYMQSQPKTSIYQSISPLQSYTHTVLQLQFCCQYDAYHTQAGVSVRSCGIYMLQAAYISIDNILYWYLPLKYRYAQYSPKGKWQKTAHIVSLHDDDIILNNFDQILGSLLHVVMTSVTTIKSQYLKLLSLSSPSYLQLAMQS